MNETIGQSMISETKNNIKGRNTTNISSSSSSSKSNIEIDNNQVGNSKTKIIQKVEIQQIYLYLHPQVNLSL